MVTGHSVEGTRFLYPFSQVDESLFSRIGGKNTNLVILYRSGLPVPPGYSVSDGVHEYFQKDNQLPSGLVEEIQAAKKILGGKIAIRSSANCEDGKKLTMAGVFESQYIYRDEDIGQAVMEIYAQSSSKAVKDYLSLQGLSVKDVRMGLVVQKLIEPDFSGVLYTGINGDNYLIQYVNGYGANLVDGKVRGSELLVDSSGAILQSIGFDARPLSKDLIYQLVLHSKKIKELFPGNPQDIEFAMKDVSSHILQARPLTSDLGKIDLRETLEDTLEFAKYTLTRTAQQERKELGTSIAIFSDGNYSELLPRPKEMDIGIHRYVWGGSDGVMGAKQLGHSSMGYIVGEDASPIIHFFGVGLILALHAMQDCITLGFLRKRKNIMQL